MGYVPWSNLKRIQDAPQIISTESEMSPTAYALTQQNPVSKHLFRPDASFAIPFYSLGDLEPHVGLKNVQTLN